MIVIPGPASVELGHKIAGELCVEAQLVEHRIFPDGESYIRLTGSVKGKAVVLVQTTSPFQDTHLIQLFQMIATARELGAERVICCVPYLAYARQDRRFLDGEAVSLRILLRMIESAGAEDLIVVDAHKEESLKEAENNLNIWPLSAIPLLAKYLKETGFDGAYSLGPDQGALHLARKGNEVLGGGFGFFEKQRDRKTGSIQMTVKNIELGGGDAVIFDDMVSSGGTMAQAVSILKRLGARRVAAACTHALFIGDAEKRVKEAGADVIVATDTVQTKFSVVSVAPLVADQIRKIV